MTFETRSRDDLARSVLAPRPYFRRKLIGSPRIASIQWASTICLPKPTTVAQKNGVRFEKKVCAFLSAAFPKLFVPGPLIEFSDSRLYKKSRAIPDGLLFSSDFRTCAVIEIKYRHTFDAWYQLSEFYIPIVRKALPGIRVIPLEVCKFWEPGVQVENLRVRESSESLDLLFQPWNSNSYNVWLWGESSKWVTSAGSRQSFNSCSVKSEFSAPS